MCASPAHKLRVVISARPLLAQGLSQGQVAERLGESPASLCRWLRAYELEGAEGLESKRDRCGAKPRFELDGEEAAALRFLVLEYRSLPLAVERFVRSPACRECTREAIFAELDRSAQAGRPPRWPMSLRRAAYVTEEMKSHHKGPKHAQNETEFSSRKQKVVRTEDGELRPMMVNEVWQSDDYSTNCPYIVVCPFTGVVSTGRQMLATIDELSYAWRSFEPIGRERDAYKAEDIARHMLRTIDAAGTMPAVWILERGAWENNLIDGIPVKVNGLERRWGGLSALFGVKRAFKSRNKAEVEGGFNLLQAQLDPEGLSIGRWRGEREAATKLMTKIHGRAKPWTVEELQGLGLWTMEQCADVHARIAGELNRRPKERWGMGYVSAEDIQAKAMKFDRPLPEGERWRFCTVKREATVRRGHVECQVKGHAVPFRFVVNGVAEGVHLDNGYKVLVAFDPLSPEAGCHVFNNETGARNYRDLPWAEFLLVAQYEGVIPSLDYTGGRREDMAPRRNAAQAARSEYREVAAMGKEAMRVSQAGDGRGNVVTVECGVRSAECGVEEESEVRPSAFHTRADAEIGAPVVKRNGPAEREREAAERSIRVAASLEKREARMLARQKAFECV